MRTFKSNLYIIFNFNLLLSWSVYVPLHRWYLSCWLQNFAWCNICQTVENTSFLKRRLSYWTLLQTFNYQCYRSNFGFHIPFECEIRQIEDQKSIFGFAERSTYPYCMLRRWREKNIYFLVVSFQDTELQKMKKWHFIGSG